MTSSRLTAAAMAVTLILLASCGESDSTPKTGKSWASEPSTPPGKSEQPTSDTPKVDPPKVDPAKVDPAKVDPPRVDPPKVDPPKVDPPKVDPPKVDPPKVDPPKVDPPVEVKTRDGGVVAEFATEDGKPCGQLKLRLGDTVAGLELWLATPEGLSFDVPLDTVVIVKMTDKDRSVQLQVKDRVRNHFGDSATNIRNGRSNYFVYPNNRTEDAGWLKDAKFRAMCLVRFEADGKRYSTAEFALVANEPSHGHSHGR